GSRPLYCLSSRYTPGGHRGQQQHDHRHRPAPGRHAAGSADGARSPRRRTRLRRRRREPLITHSVRTADERKRAGG
ncbi:unnamed protein product, partial [Amoebophrya sp. A120]